jgi:hypothetical protein
VSEKHFVWKTVRLEDRFDEELQAWVARSEDQLNGKALIRCLAYNDSKTGKRVYLVLDLLTDIWVYQGFSSQERERVWMALRDDYLRLAQYHARLGADVLGRGPELAPAKPPVLKRRSRASKKKSAQLISA